MKKHWLAFLLCTPFFFTHSANAVSDADKIKARAYVFAAEDEFNNKNYESALTGLEKAEQIMGEKIAPILVLEIKTRYELAQYEQVNKLLEKFFTVQSTSAMQKEVSPYLIKNEEKLAQAEAEAARLKIEEARRPLVNSILNSMVTIPAGSFMMGCSPSDSGCDNNEMRRHRVNIHSFKMLETEVTWDMYQPCIDAGVCNRAHDSGWGKGSRPVIHVSYTDIVEDYIPWLNALTGLTFRLPSEAEWEYAARAGSTTGYSWGNAKGSNNANCADCGSRWDFKQTAPVKSFRPNAFGFYDMHGNVWEWTADYWNDDYYGAPDDGSSWLRGDGSRRVLRGGSWLLGQRTVRVSSRREDGVAYRLGHYGFRLAQD